MQFKLHGDKEAYAALLKLKVSTQRKITRRAVTAALRIVRTRAKQDAPKDTGLLKKSLAVNVKTFSKGKNAGTTWGKVGVKFGKDKEKGPTNYIALVIYGTKPHAIVPRRAKALIASQTRRKTTTYTFIGKSAKHPGSKPQDFLTPALEGQRHGALAKFHAVLRAGILAEAAKLSKKK